MNETIGGYAAVDSGQSKKFLKSNLITNNKGEIIRFQSMINALNYMAAQGWELAQAYSVFTKESGPETHYQKKEISIQLSEGI